MFLLISKRLDGNRMGMEVFALGNLLLGVAYALQLVGGVADHRAIGFINHTMTLGAPVAYALGAARFFNRPVPVLRPLYSPTLCPWLPPSFSACFACTCCALGQC